MESTAPPIRIDWKATFSAERTFMAWVHMAVTLLSVALGLAASAWPEVRTTGLLLLMPAATSLVWALVSFYRRTHALDQQILSGLEDRVGPTMVFVVMTVVVVINTYNAWTRLSLPDDDDDLHEP